MAKTIRMGSATMLTPEELSELQKNYGHVQGLKMRIGDTELQKQNLIQQVNQMAAILNQIEKKMVEKYGEDAIINIESGRITYKDLKNN